ncbi:hypothetical protein BKA56DRAFT_715094 [Ilyonectria sp. MPI-CAGE-AT-0026]|nr:hypothetical protein BKA56DRAFT_715094 [Ilyonectria sp. MPI-CAGE-AT-0026]
MASESNEAGGSIPHDTGNGQSSNPTPETDLSAQTPRAADQMLKHKHDREVHDKKWWGDRHTLPAPEDPDRKFVFATTSNATITDDEVTAEVRNWKKKMTNPTTGEVEPMGLHLRQSSPPVERAERARDKLIEQNIEVSDETYKTIFDQFTQNSGLDASMLEFFRDKKEVPVEYVNELRRRIDRLKMEMGKQLAKREGEFHKLETDFDDFKKDSEKEKLELAKEVQRLQDSPNVGNDATRATSGADMEDENTWIGDGPQENEREIGILRDANVFMSTELENQKSKNTWLEAENRRLESDLKALEDGVKRLTQGLYNVQGDLLSTTPELTAEPEAMSLDTGLDNRSDGQNPLYPADSSSSNDLGGERQNFGTIINKLEDEIDSLKAKHSACAEENEKLKVFFGKMHSEVQTTRSGWSLFIKQVSEMPDEEQELSAETRLLITKMYEGWTDLERKFLTGWPGAQSSLKDGQLRRDVLTHAALDKAVISLQQKFEHVVELTLALNEREKEYVTTLNRLDILRTNDSELRREHGEALNNDGNDTNPLPQAWEDSENRGTEGVVDAAGVIW